MRHPWKMPGFGLLDALIYSGGCFTGVEEGVALGAAAEGAAGASAGAAAAASAAAASTAAASTAAASGITLTQLASAASLASTVIGGITAGKGAEETATANAAAANFNAQIAKNNESAAQKAADLTMAAGEQSSANAGMRTKQVVGEEIASQAAGNIDVNTGSAPAVRLGETLAGNTNALTIRSNAAQQAYSQLQQGQNFGAESKLLAGKAQQDIIAGDIGAETAMFGAASQGASNLANWNVKGIF